ncbi:hypothetical protein ACA910_005547 [Epithemia clementina (nom. ined.)]
MTAFTSLKQRREQRQRQPFLTFIMASRLLLLLLHGSVVQSKWVFSRRYGGAYGDGSFIELNPDYVPHPSKLKAWSSSSSSSSSASARLDSSTDSSSTAARRSIQSTRGGDDLDQVYYSSYNVEVTELDTMTTSSTTSTHRSAKTLEWTSSPLSATETFSQSPFFLSSSSSSSSSSRNKMDLWSLIQQGATLYPSLAATVAACVSVFLAWQTSHTFHQQHRLLRNWFIASRSNVQQGRWPCLMLSAVSHSSVMHLLVNLMTLLSFGPAVQRSLQQQHYHQAQQQYPWPIWPLLLGSTLSGSILYLLWQLATGSSTSAGCMGLSAVTCALVQVFCRMHPDAQLNMLVAGVIPLHMTARVLSRVLWIVAGAGMLLETQDGGTTTAHAAHLGGLAFGWAYHEAWKRRYRWAWKLHQLQSAMKTMLFSTSK